MPVRIVTDSTCDLPRDVIERLGLTVVPLTVSFGAESFLDGVDIDPPTFFARMRTFDGLPRTSQPSVQAFRAAYESLGDAPDGVVSIHISSRMSGTVNSARLAAEALGARPAIEIIDSLNVSMGLGAIVTLAAEAARDGASLAEVASVAREAIPRVHVIAMLDTLEFLRRGGRIGRAQSLLGSLLNIKPILHIENGEMAPLERVRTRGRAIDRLRELATADPAITRLYVASAGDEAGANALIELIRPSLPKTEIILGHLGPVVGSHSGPGLIGFCPVKAL